ncbi:DUF2946 family protein [Sphingomonas sp.]|uniref:DUF2946 family protein n=1 Tax=Sphingomonas sp. TaxID=28214 RepID=UPI002B6A97E8|nr:DUF2946 family protein [Sphingomonas sp.]HTG39071.1 DUF2946 family protein [Sphingomonas sp.]
MTGLRRLARDHAPLTALLLAAVLLLRLLMPAGFMPVADGNGSLTVMVCSGEGSRAMTIAIPGLGERPAKPAPQERDKAGSPCAFGSLAAAFLGSVDPALLGAALAIVALLALRSVTPAPHRAARHLRPPLRGPPAPSIA